MGRADLHVVSMEPSNKDIRLRADLHVVSLEPSNKGITLRAGFIKSYGQSG